MRASICPFCRLDSSRTCDASAPERVASVWICGAKSSLTTFESGASGQIHHVLKQHICNTYPKIRLGAHALRVLRPLRLLQEGAHAHVVEQAVLL